jgi:hypothetical protein
MHRVAARMPISPQVGHVRSAGGDPRASTSTISAQAARSSSGGGTIANWRSIAATKERRVATDLSPWLIDIGIPLVRLPVHAARHSCHRQIWLPHVPPVSRSVELIDRYFILREYATLLPR